MEAARKSDEDKEVRAAAAAAEPAGATFLADIERLTAGPAGGKDLPSALDLVTPAGGPSISAPPPETALVATPDGASRPKVDEVLVCSAQGEVLYEWQCANTDLWVNLFEFVSQRGHRLAQALPLGEFNRLEIQSGGVRAVVIITSDRGVLVKTRREATSP